MKITHIIDNEEYTSIAGAAEYLGVHIRTLQRYIREGRIKALKLSERKFYVSIKHLKEITNHG